MNKYLIYTLLVLFGCCISCDILNSDNHPKIDIRTDKDHYDLKEDRFIKVTITNKSHQIIYYSTCLSKTVEAVKKNKSEKTLGLPVCYCLCPAELKPGKSMPVHISSISTEAFQPKGHMSSESIRYQINYALYLDEAFSDHPISAKYSRSNTFTIAGIK